MCRSTVAAMAALVASCMHTAHAFLPWFSPAVGQQECFKKGLAQMPWPKAHSPQREGARRHAGHSRAAHTAAEAPGSQGGLNLQQLLDFERKGHIKTEAVAPAAESEALGAAVRAEYMRRRKEAYVQKIRLFAAEDEDDALYQRALECSSEEDARDLLQSWCDENEVPCPFLQIFNVHRGTTRDARAIYSFATSPRMGALAAELLGVPSVRLYQTSVFMKERGHGETSWHADLATSPFDTNSMVTCWIALTRIDTEEDSPLEFASGSHRDLALPYWYSLDGMDKPSGDDREYDVDVHLPLAPGDATWHHGWLFHAAPPNDGRHDRLALAISYVSASAHVLDTQDRHGLRRVPEDEDCESYMDWLQDMKGGDAVTHALLPVVFPPTMLAEPKLRRDTPGDKRRPHAEGPTECG